MEEIKEKLNKYEENQVSGGTESISANDTGTFENSNGKSYEVICDICRKPIRGKAGIMCDSKGNNYCLDCTSKKQAILKDAGLTETFTTKDVKYNSKQPL